MDVAIAGGGICGLSLALNLADFFPLHETWHFDWLDVTKLIRDAEQILEYPMVDKDPIDRWTFGCVTLAGDAAHPMYPRGSNGAAQATIDARTLADLLKAGSEPRAALKAYEAARVAPAAKVVRTNRDSLRISSISRSRSWSAIDLSTISTNTSRRMSCERCRRVTSGSPASRWRMLWIDHSSLRD